MTFLISFLNNGLVLIEQSYYSGYANWEFLQDLVEKLLPLQKHHFISKIQSTYLKELKQNLSEDICIKSMWFCWEFHVCNTRCNSEF